MPANSIGDRESFTPGTPGATQRLRLSLNTGELVMVRGRRRRVRATVQHRDCSEVWFDSHPRAVEMVLWPFDRPGTIQTNGRLRITRLRHWYRGLRKSAADEIDALTPRARIADVRVVPFQLAPCLAVAAGASRVLLADEVGLGKTIQAGWIVADVVARDPSARVLLAVPAAVKHQWIEELSRRFALAVESAGARWLRARVADLPDDVGPWAAPGIYAVSLDFVKRADVAASARAQWWDLLVIDEAHTVTAPTERHAAMAAVAGVARRVVLITATPYSGDTAAFGSMIGLGSAGHDQPLLFRRRRNEVGDSRHRSHRFAAIRLSRRETRFQRLLERYSREVWRAAPGDVSGARLAVTILRKRALSSPIAAAHSLRRRLLLLSLRAPGAQQLGLFDDEDGVDDETPDTVLAIPGLSDTAKEERWLLALIEAADAAAAVDSKIRFLRRLLRRLPTEPAVVFTEYRDTLRILAGLLPPSLQLHGGMSGRERAAVQASFNCNGGLLLATDAAAEGLNLHGQCRLVVSFELPWNPARLEQRIGRVDRIGQRRTVHAITLVARDTAEEMVIGNLVRRLGRVVTVFGGADPLGAFLDEARVARMVMSDLDSHRDDDAAALPVLDAAPPAGDVEQRACDLIEARATRAPHSRPDGVLVSSTRASRLLPPGVIVVLRCTATTAGGTIVASRVASIHLASVPRKPITRRAAWELASATIERGRPWTPVVPGLVEWFESVQRQHRSSEGAFLDREMLLRAALTGGQEQLQPGLFDRRAIAAADRRARRDADLDEASDQRLDALRRSHDLELHCDPTAVLIAWR